MTSIHKQRRDRIKQTVCSLNADAFLVSSLVNVRYLCGFTGSNGFLVISKDGDFLITDSRYLEQGSEETNNEIAIFLSSGVRGLTELPVFNQIKTLVIESSNLTYSEFKFIEELVSDRLDLLPKNGLIEKIRAIKNRDEIDNIHLKARGKSISNAVNVAEQFKNRFSNEIKANVDDVSIGTEEVPRKDKKGKIKMSFIDTTMSKIKEEKD